MPGVLLFSVRIVLELLLAPVRALRRLLGGAERRPPATAPAEPAPAEPAPPPRQAPPRRRKPRSEPTRGQVAAMREAAREAETGGADSVGADVRIGEPWPDYDEMGLEDVLTRIQAASEVELAVVRVYEREHEARQAVLLAAGEPA
jgi:hypothetical protein